MLYYFSHICASTTPLAETYIDGRPITVIRAEVDSSTAPLVPLPSFLRTSSRSSIPSLEPPRRPPRFQTNERDVGLNIDVTRKDTMLGLKEYKGMLETRQKVFVKLWESWKCSPDEMDNEVAVYSTLHSMWGNFIPRVIDYDGWGFCHTIVLEFIEVFHSRFSGFWC
jgi:hypothetical protein